MREPWHILYVLHCLGGGGTENGVVNLLNRADPDRFRFTLVLLRAERELLARVERPGVDVVTVARKWGNDPLHVIRMIRTIRRARPDLVHTRGFSCIESLAAARLAGVRAVVHGEHGRDADEADAMKPRRAALRSFLYRYADHVVTVSEELRDAILRQVRVPPEKVQCLPNGVDLRRFSGGVDRRTARRRLGLPVDARVVGSLGRLDPVKDYGSLLRAFARIHAHRRDAWLVLAGSGPQEAALRGAATDLGIADRTLFLGFRDDVSSALAAMDVFVLPSITEGMSNALLEAMASGLPCVATRVGGNAELVEEGRTGLLVAPRDVETLSIAVQYLVGDPHLAECMGRAGRARVESRFSLGGMVERYQELYLSLLEGRSPDVVRRVVPAAAAAAVPRGALRRAVGVP